MAASTRLVIGSLILLSVIGYMSYLGASSSWQYYLTVDECMANASTLLDQRVRVSGTIAAESLRAAKNRMGATFMLEGMDGCLSVSCSGQLPDNLAEGRHVVVEGRLQDVDNLIGEKVLTRCASKYSSGTSVANSDKSRMAE